MFARVVDLQVLGPLKLLAGGELVRLGPKQRVLLSCLWLAGGQGVTAARLADLLWGGSEPDGWKATLRSHIYHLRRAIDGGAAINGAGPVVVTERVGAVLCYALCIPREMVDASRFERLAAEGRTALSDGRYAPAAVTLKDALALWRGQPLADVASSPFAVPEIKRLEGLHRAAEMARIEAEVQLGLHREVIGELEAMLVRWPGDEGLRRLLVTCLCRAGRLAEAALLCRQGIRLALDQGLDVKALQSLQLDILLGREALAPQ